MLNLEKIRDKLLAEPVYACDLETTGLSLEEDEITIVALATIVNGKPEGWSVEVRDHPLEEIKEVLGPVFRDKSKTAVFHNCAFDVKFLNKYGIYLSNKLADTMVMAWLHDEDVKRYGSQISAPGLRGGYNLKYCTYKELNYRMSSYDEARSLFGDFEEYAADDAIQTLNLYFHFKKILEKDKLMEWFETIEMPVAQAVIDMETRGVTLDKQQLKRLKKEAIVAAEKAEQDVFDEAGYKFNVASSKQLAHILFTEKKIGMRSNDPRDGNDYSFVSEKSNEWSTAVAVLDAMSRDGHEIATKILKFREINTRLNTFIKPLLARCRYGTVIHPRFNQVRTVTGRFASSDPNYQQLPRKGGVRAAFVARIGHKIVKADYSQAELRLMSHMSRDPIMMDIYRNDGDIHQTTADACQVSRQAAKAINFGLIYRMSGKRLMAQLALQGIKITKSEAYQYVNRYFRQYKRVKDYHELVEKTVMQRLAQDGRYGYIRTLGGRYRRLDREYLTNELTNYTAITQAINATIQGGVSDLIKVAMVDAQNEFRHRGWLNPEKDIWRACMQGQVHDEIFVECEEELAEEVSSIVSNSMVNAGIKYKIRVPMAADAEIVDSLAKG